MTTDLLGRRTGPDAPTSRGLGFLPELRQGLGIYSHRPPPPKVATPAAEHRRRQRQAEADAADDAAEQEVWVVSGARTRQPARHDASPRRH